MNKIYLKILRVGMTHLRDLCNQGLIEEAKIEAEHLHNIPSLINETNIVIHEYYYREERSRYLLSVANCANRNVFDLIIPFYHEQWKNLKLEYNNLSES
jgi:hypothetical protein